MILFLCVIIVLVVLFYCFILGLNRPLRCTRTVHTYYADIYICVLYTYPSVHLKTERYFGLLVELNIGDVLNTVPAALFHTVNIQYVIKYSIVSSPKTNHKCTINVNPYIFVCFILNLLKQFDFISILVRHFSLPLHSQTWHSKTNFILFELLIGINTLYAL